MSPQQPAPATQQAPQQSGVGNSGFESWYNSYSPAHKSDKQRACDAYAAGMGDPLVTTAPAAVAGPSVPDDVARDAERYRWLAGYCRSTSEHWGGRWSIIIDGPAPKTHDSEDDLDAAIDAAMLAAQDSA